MVRLRGNDRWRFVEALKEFQFLNGTIKSADAATGKLGEIKFQFLNGTIKSFAYWSWRYCSNEISIPKWYD